MAQISRLDKLMTYCDVDILIIGQAPCSQGSIRLQGGTNSSGYVEVCHINFWGRVCGDTIWGIANAQVTCRQLGLPNTGATTVTVSAVPDRTRVSWLRNVRCVGNENSLFKCNVQPSETNCYNTWYAGVSCQDSKSKVINLNVLPCMICD